MKVRAASPGLLPANLLYSLSMALIVTLGAWMQAGEPRWGLIATELLLILAPTLLFARRQRLEVRRAFRLRRPGWALAGLALLIGAGLWPIGLFLELLSSLLFGLPTPVGADSLPNTAGQSAPWVVALVIAAPLCEELMFRGYLLRAYEQRGRRVALVASALLFAFFHLRLRGLPALLPIAFTLGYLTLRSDSIVPAILAHAANNGMQAALGIASGMGFIDVRSVSFAAGLGGMLAIGLIALGVALWLFARLTREAAAPHDAAPPQPRRGWLWAAPLLAAAAIYAYAARAEVLLATAPEKLADPLELAAPTVESVESWAYEIRTKAEAPIGKVECRLQSGRTVWALSCEQTVVASETTIGLSSYYTADLTRRLVEQRDIATVAPVALHKVDQFAAQAVTTTLDGARIVQAWDGEIAEMPLPIGAPALFEETWPFWCAGIDFQTGTLGKVWLVRTEGSGPPVAAEAAVLVLGKETVVVPAGNYEAWRVKVDYLTPYGRNQHTAWYTVAAPHTLVRVETNVTTAVLIP